ncbi:MAG: hypothetical protein K8R77_01575 [Anaerolineaceae bacterium]|nr:hypothetical protein [Anaerolineaceae bacterium]
MMPKNPPKTIHKKLLPRLYWYIILGLFIIFNFPVKSKKIQLILLIETNVLSFYLFLECFYRYKTSNYGAVANILKEINEQTNNELLKILSKPNGAYTAKSNVVFALLLPSFFCSISSFVLSHKIESAFWTTFFSSVAIIMFLIAAASLIYHIVILYKSKSSNLV